MKQPNIILFNPDQWRGDVMGHVGNPAAMTPNLDRLVREDAVSFSRAFCQNPVCTPSRCSYMSGWYPHVRGHRTMHHMLHPEHGEPNLLKMLKQNGYFVWWGGKNDLTPGQHDPTPYCDIRFQADEADYARWNCTRREDSFAGDQAWRGNPDGDNFFSFFRGCLDKGDDDFYCDFDWEIVLGAIDFIRQHKSDQPFFLNLSLFFPHPPYCVEEPWYSLIDRSKLPPRPVMPEGGVGKPAVLKSLLEEQGLQGWSEERWAELRGCYYGMCARLDHQFGLIVEALKENGLYDDTAMFVFSDHGDYTGDYGIVEKTHNTMEDCLTHVPLIIKPPHDSAVQPRVCDALVELVDFSATVFDLTGMEPDYDSFGRSLLPLVAGETDAHRDAVFCEGGRRKGEQQAMEADSWKARGEEGLYTPRLKLQLDDSGPYHGKAAMCRTGTHKYIRRLYEEDELYDLTTDPHEVCNIIHRPEAQAVLTELRERMLCWYQETCDVVPREADRR
jgi:arylsulfatase A-like enzyme